MALRHLVRLPALLVFTLHMIAWYLVDISVYSSLAVAAKRLAPQPLAIHEQPGWAFLPAWLVREGLALPVWTIAMCGNRVVWRDPHSSWQISKGKIVQLEQESEDMH